MTGAERRSRKRFGTKAESLLEKSTFFVDDCLGSRVGGALRVAGFKVELHKDHFAPATPDAEWMPTVGSWGWVVLTKDKGMRRKPAEIAALKAARLAVFTLARGDMTGEEAARLFITNRLNIGRFLKNHHPPFIAHVSESGVRQVYSYPAE
jgi:hypothetical protein